MNSGISVKNSFIVAVIVAIANFVTSIFILSNRSNGFDKYTLFWGGIFTGIFLTIYGLIRRKKLHWEDEI